MDEIGFTDDEINQLNSNRNLQSKQTTTKTNGQRSERTSQPSSKHVKVIGDLNGASFTKPVDRAAKQREFREKLAAETKSVKSPEVSVTDEVTLVQESSPQKPVQQEIMNQTSLQANEEVVIPSENESEGASNDRVNEETESTTATEDDNPFKPYQQQNLDFEVQLTKVEQLQQAQAKLQKENRQKQKHLKETITEKFTKTAQQANLLKTLQNEVASVERELTCDISILRDRIDHCNRRCHDASKRYETAEQEFVAAKLDLHKCKELKEGLQEHLFTIIKLNETKKSEKLSELHNRLENLGLE
ncbi:RAB6-interacting golgin-like [Bolinopsis microptera]|uniref:RAB6-interacting golgin-like n=1 Tax=Bolinopsis microptera TaxID=2820187 RepID=UPI0030792A72